MKKLIALLFAFSVIGFSETCNWTNDPDSSLRKYISAIKKHNMINKMYCDKYGYYMLYWRSNYGSDIDIGFMLNDEKTTHLDLNDIMNSFSNFANELVMLDEVKLRQKNGDKFPEHLNVRLYMYDPDYKDTYMIFKIVADFNNKSSTLYYNQRYFKNFKGFIDEAAKQNDFYPTDDIIY